MRTRRTTTTTRWTPRSRFAAPRLQLGTTRRTSPLATSRTAATTSSARRRFARLRRTLRSSDPASAATLPRRWATAWAWLRSAASSSSTSSARTGPTWRASCRSSGRSARRRPRRCRRLWPRLNNCLRSGSGGPRRPWRTSSARPSAAPSRVPSPRRRTCSARRSKPKDSTAARFWRPRLPSKTRPTTTSKRRTTRASRSWAASRAGGGGCAAAARRRLPLSTRGGLREASRAVYPMSPRRRRPWS
mmetsp:Transcript_30100/g.101477  ORF Transcript_30100/g.101477 Transcript_30100/m.101477 type:complete len:246 (+) Transcript_30100:883-1620(+)